MLSCNGNTKIRTKIDPSSWRLCVITCCGFGMHSFGNLGGNNDLNDLDRNPLVRNLLIGHANRVGFGVNGNWYDKYYLFADGIYPKWSCFVQSLQDPKYQKESNFSASHESARKYVEKCFVVLQSR